VPTYLIRAVDPSDRNSNGRNAVIVTAPTEGEARELADANAPNGETRVRPGWVATRIADSEESTVLWVQGNVVVPEADGRAVHRGA